MIRYACGLDPYPKLMRVLVAQSQGIQCPHQGNRSHSCQGKQSGTYCELGPGRYADDTVQPGGQNAVAGARFVEELEEVAGIGEHGADGKTGQQKGHHVGLARRSSQRVHQRHGSRRAGEGQQRGGAEAEDRPLGEERDADAGAEDRASRRSDDVGVGDGIAKEPLKQKTGQRQRRAHHARSQHPRQAKLKQDEPLRFGQRMMSEHGGKDRAGRDRHRAGRERDQGRQAQRHRQQHDERHRAEFACFTLADFGRVPGWSEAAGRLDTVAISIAKIRLQS